MDKLRFGSVLLLGILTASVSGLALAARGDRGGSGGFGGHGGYQRPGGGYHGHDHDHWGVGIVVDPFLFGSWYYPSPYYYPPYYYPPAVVTVPATPPVYIERGESDAPAASAFWYYCTNPQGYYPDVKQCPGGWQPVPPRQPTAPEEGR